jgi:hypothetical protein
MSLELGVHFVGNVKTATKNFPKKEMWACLEGGERGDHVVFRHVPSGIHAVGWNNGFKKIFVCSAGSSNPVTQARRRCTSASETMARPSSGGRNALT